METIEITETTESVNERIAKNLIYYRKAAGWTQAELAALINYSDKSVSKWESAGGVPDIYILLKLAQLYDITVDDLVYGEAKEKDSEEAEKARSKKLFSWAEILLMLLSSGIVWLIATIGFVFGNFLAPGKPWWLIFISALPVNSVIILIFSAIWKKTLLNFVSVSALIWTALLCIYLVLRAVTSGINAIDIHNLWLIFLLGIPLQVLEVFWAFFRHTLKVKRKVKAEETVQKEETDVR